MQYAATVKHESQRENLKNTWSEGILLQKADDLEPTSQEQWRPEDNGTMES